MLGALAACALLGAPSDASAQTSVRDINRNVLLISGMGGKCFDVEGERVANGTRLIGFGCTNRANQQFFFTREGTIVHNGKCVDARRGRGQNGDELVLWDCNGGPNQKWQLRNGRLTGINGKCVDLSGGRGHWLGNQPAVLWDCHGGENQQWRWAVVVPQSRLQGVTVVQTSQLTPINPVVREQDVRLLFDQAARVIAAGGGNVIAAGGGNVIAAGGLN